MPHSQTALLPGEKSPISSRTGAQSLVLEIKNPENQRISGRVVSDDELTAEVDEQFGPDEK